MGVDEVVGTNERSVLAPRHSDIFLPTLLEVRE
jgi:hypothetical protein